MSISSLPENPGTIEGGLICGEQFFKVADIETTYLNPLIRFLDLTYNLRQYGLIVKTGFLKARLMLGA